ncbi:MAG TPA: hypothetical protein VFV19_17690 [Candidatus Polarisedimenticolaceae bacterium]|nr:hypothetical protein [Candidatus Polarisedimenticolaceae bacterium]
MWQTERSDRVSPVRRHLPRPVPRRRWAALPSLERTKRSDHPWTLLLASGEGRGFGDFSIRLSGKNIPKQFWSLDGSGGMLDWAVARAARISPPDRTLAIVRTEHLRWSECALRAVPTANVILEPADRGTAPGILLALMHLGHLEPDATVVLLPCDHHVEGEGMLAEAMGAAAAVAERRPELVVVLGAAAHTRVPGCPWLVPGALASTGIAVAKRSALIALFTATVPDLVADCVTWSIDGERSRSALRSLYETIPTRDFNRQVLYKAPTSLAVAEIPSCGFTDLGSPGKLSRFLRAQTEPATPDFLRRSLGSTTRVSA